MPHHATLGGSDTDGVVHEFPPDECGNQAAGWELCRPKPQTPAEQIQAVPSLAIRPS